VAGVGWLAATLTLKAQAWVLIGDSLTHEQTVIDANLKKSSSGTRRLVTSPNFLQPQSVS
jgi:hypothetical protein